MNSIIRTDSTHPGFVTLVSELDRYLAVTDGDEHSFYAQYNTIVNISKVVILFAGGEAVACGAIRPFGDDTMEVKRMYTRPACRGQGHAAAVLAALEQWAAETGHTRCVLETGKRQAAAIRLYMRCGYRVTANYGQYAGVANSVCFAKHLGAGAL